MIIMIKKKYKFQFMKEKKVDICIDTLFYDDGNVILEQVYSVLDKLL